MNPSICSAFKARWLLCALPTSETGHSTFCTQSEFIWFVCISGKKKAIICLCGFNHTIFIRSAVCLLRGTSWMFKYSSGLIEVFKQTSRVRSFLIVWNFVFLWNIIMNTSWAILMFCVFRVFHFTVYWIQHHTVVGRYINHMVYPRGELSYLSPLDSEQISAPYFKQCFFRGGGGGCITPRLSQTPRLPVPRQK
jgi:hypothetical protein